jgi:uncharacterized protein YbjQ (UPF0145 family)
MKKIFMIIAVGSLFLSMVAAARDTVLPYPVADALNSEQAKAKLGTSVKFYFGDQAYGTVEKKLSEYRTNRKTNAFNKSDKEACEWVFLSAMLALRDRALQEGADAVVNIRSNYRNNLTSSNDTYQCGSGALVAGVALVGDLVKLKQ